MVGAVLLLVGCMQEPEGRYEIRASKSSTWLLDSKTGCVWMFAGGGTADFQFYLIPVKGLHEGEALKEVEGCSKEG